MSPRARRPIERRALFLSDNDFTVRIISGADRLIVRGILMRVVPDARRRPMAQSEPERIADAPVLGTMIGGEWVCACS